MDDGPSRSGGRSCGLKTFSACPVVSISIQRGEKKGIGLQVVERMPTRADLGRWLNRHSVHGSHDRSLPCCNAQKLTGSQHGIWGFFIRWLGGLHLNKTRILDQGEKHKISMNRSNFRVSTQ